MTARPLIARLHPPRTTVRWRLTLLYSGLFLVCGAALLVVTYSLVAHQTLNAGPVRYKSVFAPVLPLPGATVIARPGSIAQPGSIGAAVPFGPLDPRTAAQVRRILRSNPGRVVVSIAGSGQRTSDLHQLEVESVIALAIMAVISTLLGWLMAGRVLRPLRTMTEATQAITAASLHQRLAMAGPPDELRRLADTIDGLLGRLEASFEAQRQFVANASHELRTPLTAVRAVLELVLSDPRATVAGFRTASRQVLEETGQQEQLIEALLALAQGQRGLERREPVELAAVAGELVGPARERAATAGLTLDSELSTAWLSGDPRLIRRLVSNLLDNAIAHNVSGGEVHLWVSVQEGGARLAVANSGVALDAAEVGRLTDPFRRGRIERTGHGAGLGLGLSIVEAIARAHDADLLLAPRPEGGLVVTVSFPATAPLPHAPPALIQAATIAPPGGEDRLPSLAPQPPDAVPSGHVRGADPGAPRLRRRA